jgi:hypothetical protein
VVIAHDCQVSSNICLIQKATSTTRYSYISTRIVGSHGVPVPPDGACRVPIVIHNDGTSLVLHQHLGVALTSQGVATVRGDVPTGIVTIRLELDGTIQIERNVSALGARSTGTGPEFDEKYIIGGATKTASILVFGVLEIIVRHAIALCESSRHCECPDGHACQDGGSKLHGCVNSSDDTNVTGKRAYVRAS